MEDSKLLDLRNKIDSIDVEVLALLAKRAELVLQVGQLKHAGGGENNFIRSGREARMIRDLGEKGAGAFPKPAIRSLWRSIISASLGLENGLKVALPKDLDFNQNREVIEYFGSFSEYTQHDSEDDVLNAIDKNTIGIFTLKTGWWLSLADEKHRNLKIFAKLADGVFAVARLETEDSGDDVTVAITHSDERDDNHIAIHGKVELIEVSGFHRELDKAVVIGNYGI